MDTDPKILLSSSESITDNESDIDSDTDSEGENDKKKRINKKERRVHFNEEVIIRPFYSISIDDKDQLMSVDELDNTDAITKSYLPEYTKTTSQLKLISALSPNFQLFGTKSCAKRMTIFDILERYVGKDKEGKFIILDHNEYNADKSELEYLRFCLIGNDHLNILKISQVDDKGRYQLLPHLEIRLSYPCAGFREKLIEFLEKNHFIVDSSEDENSQDILIVYSSPEHYLTKLGTTQTRQVPVAFNSCLKNHPYYAFFQQVKSLVELLNLQNVVKMSFIKNINSSFERVMISPKLQNNFEIIALRDAFEKCSVKTNLDKGLLFIEYDAKNSEIMKNFSLTSEHQQFCNSYKDSLTSLKSENIENMEQNKQDKKLLKKL